MKKTLLTLSILLFILVFDAKLLIAQTTQIPLPAQTSTFTGSVRGFWFTSPIDLKITGLRVPITAGTGTQNIQLMLCPTAPPPFPGTQTNYTTLTYIQGAPNGVIQTVDIDIAAGDIVGVLGQAGTTTSYGPSGPFTSSIDGNPVTLTRLLYQGSINTAQAGPISEELSGSLGRVEIYWELPTTSQDDIGIVSIDSPNVFCPGVFDVYAKLRNFGINPVTSATIDWTVDGVPQPSVNFTGSLDTAGGSGSNTAQILLGSFNFATANPYNVVAWTSNPNGVADTVNQNDTATAVLQSNLPAPANIATSNLLPFSVDLSWSGGSANTWLWLNLPSGTPPTGNGAFSATTSVSLSGLSSNTAYDFYVREVCPSGDTSLWSLFSYITPCATYTAPFTENFDGIQWSLTTPFPIDQCWSKTPPAPVTGYRWQTEDGQPTSGTGTGPSGDVSGSGKYVYTESSSGAVGNIADLETPLIDVSTLTQPQVDFYYHMHGATIGTMELEIFDNNVWTQLWTLSGAQQSANTDPWIKVSLPFTNISNIVQFRFRGTRGTSFTSDMAIDEFGVREAPTCPDLNNTISSNILPTSADLAWTSFGNGNNFQVEYGLSGFTIGNGIQVSAIDTFVTITGLTANSVYDWYVREICAPGDTSAWTVRADFITPCTIFGAPFFENFDGPQWSLTTPFPIDQCWSKTPITGYQWQTEDGQPTSGVGSGPNADVSGLGKYVYTESSSGVLGAVADLESPLIDISTLTAPQVEFFYHMHGATTGTMNLEINDNGVWTNIWSLTGAQQSSNTDPWINVSVPFSTVSDTIKFRFSGSKGSSFTSDMAIDEVRLRDAPNDDLAVTDVTGLATACGLTSNESFFVEIENKGANSQSNFDIEYSINGGAYILGVTVTTPLAFAQTQAYAINSVDLSGPGQKCIDVRVVLPNDEDSTNNVFPTICIFNQAVPTIDSVINGEVCNGGSITLQAQFTGANLNWYDDVALTNQVNTGANYTANFTTTTTFYLQAVNANGCTSPVQTVVAEVNFTPSVNFTRVVNNCTVNFTGIVSNNTDSVRWDFGDMVGTSNLNSPTYVYNASQSFPVR